MEYVFEFILDLVLEGSIEVSKSNKIPKYIRYPLIGLLSLFSIAVIGFMLFAGVISLKENVLLGTFVILIALVLLIMGIIKFRKMYLIKINKN